MANPVRSLRPRAVEPAHAASEGRSFRSDIEGLRGIAVLLVVLFHARVPGVEGGFIGVDVFFVLSGYLITGILVNEIERTGQLSFLEFYARRARRLLPAAIVTILCTLGAAAFFLSPIEQLSFSRTARATSLYLSNAWFMRQAADYFSPAIENNALLHTWSLAVEEQFYLVWPLLLVIAWRARAAVSSIVIAVAGLSIVSLAMSIWLTNYRPIWAFYGSPPRAWEFGIGALACFVPVSHISHSRSLRSILALGGFVAIGMAAVLFSTTTSFPGSAALLPVLGTTAVLVAGSTGQRDGVLRLLDTSPLQRLGKLSYSWYLWHWPVLVIALSLIPSLSVAGRLACALGSLVIAAIVHATIENTIRYNRYLVARPRQTLGYAVTITVVGVAAATTAHGVAARSMRAPRQQVIAQAAADITALKGSGCFAPGSEPIGCVRGDTTAPTTVVLFGDSHAAQWFAGLDDLAREKRWRLVSFIKANCPAVDVTVRKPNIMRTFVECDTWRQRSLESMSELKPALVIASSFQGYASRAGQIVAPDPLVAWRDGSRALFERFDSAAVPLIVLRDTPRPGFDVPACLSRRAHNEFYKRLSCDASATDALNADVLSAEMTAATGLPRVTLVDLSDHFCAAGTCPSEIEGMIVYRDENHITGRFARSLRTVLEGAIAPHVVAPQYAKSESND